MDEFIMTIATTIATVTKIKDEAHKERCKDLLERLLARIDEEHLIEAMKLVKSWESKKD